MNKKMIARAHRLHCQNGDTWVEIAEELGVCPVLLWRLMNSPKVKAYRKSL